MFFGGVVRKGLVCMFCVCLHVDVVFFFFFSPCRLFISDGENEMKSLKCWRAFDLYRNRNNRR